MPLSARMILRERPNGPMGPRVLALLQEPIVLNAFAFTLNAQIAQENDFVLVRSWVCFCRISDVQVPDRCEDSSSTSITEGTKPPMHLSLAVRTKYRGCHRRPAALYMSIVNSLLVQYTSVKHPPITGQGRQSQPQTLIRPLLTIPCPRSAHALGGHRCRAQ